MPVERSGVAAQQSLIQKGGRGAAAGEAAFLDQLWKELMERTYRPRKARKVEIPKRGGKMRQLSIPSIRDRVVKGALKLILEPLFETESNELASLI